MHAADRKSFLNVLPFQTAAELERRREKFTKELDFVFADVVCLSINKSCLSLLLVWL